MNYKMFFVLFLYILTKILLESSLFSKRLIKLKNSNIQNILENYVYFLKQSTKNRLFFKQTY